MSTDEHGRAVMHGLRTNTTVGIFKIQVIASFQSHVGTAVITQTNTTASAGVAPPLTVDASAAAVAVAAVAAGGAAAAAVAVPVAGPGATGQVAGALVGVPSAIVLGPVTTARALLTDPDKAVIKPTKSLWVGAHEADGYGLYSYILFASHPGPARYDDYRALIKEYLSVFGDVADYQGLRRKDLNVTYLPIAPKRDPEQKEPLHDWILENYGYQRAIQLLQKVGVQTTNGGPYIISSPIPLTETAKKPTLVFYQDLEGVPGRLMALYLRRYEYEVRRPPSRTTHAINSMALQVRKMISQFAEETTTALALSDVLHLVNVSASRTEEITIAPAKPTAAPAAARPSR